MSEQDILGLSYSNYYHTQKLTFEELLSGYRGITTATSTAVTDNLVYRPIQCDTIITGTFSKSLNEKYVCPFCGTVYIATDGGFVPECKNCGGAMRLEE